MRLLAAILLALLFGYAAMWSRLMGRAAEPQEAGVMDWYAHMVPEVNGFLHGTRAHVNGR